MAQKNTSFILLGIKHSGKSTQGKLLAKKLNCAFYDTDKIITQTTKKSPREIYTKDGADAFMRAEQDACQMIASLHDSSTHQQAATCARRKRFRCVIATGGGICDNEAAIATLRSIGRFVFLQTSEQIAAQRIVRKISVDDDGKMQNLPAYIAKENPKNMEDVRKIFHAYYERRTNAYMQIADIVIKIEDAPVWKNAELIYESVFAN